MQKTSLLFDTLGRLADGPGNDNFQNGHGFYGLFETKKAFDDEKVHNNACPLNAFDGPSAIFIRIR